MQQMLPFNPTWPAITPFKTPLRHLRLYSFGSGDSGGLTSLFWQQPDLQVTMCWQGKPCTAAAMCAQACKLRSANSKITAAEQQQNQAGHVAEQCSQQGTPA